LQRWRGHLEGEEVYSGVYREPAIISTDTAADPIDLLEIALTVAGLDGKRLRADLTQAEEALIQQALANAQAAPIPEVETALEDVFA
jgi:TPP-dependent pyruvate/acetoin dehydrogenase alpha subunit